MFLKLCLCHLLENCHYKKQFKITRFHEKMTLDGKFRCNFSLNYAIDGMTVVWSFVKRIKSTIIRS